MSHSERKRTIGALVFAGFFGASSMSKAAFNMSQITDWAGAGSNSAALVIDWSSPMDLGGSGVNPPAGEVVMAFGYHFNGAATGGQMFDAIMAANFGLFSQRDPDFVESIGFDLNHNGTYGVTDGTTTLGASTFRASGGEVSGAAYDSDTFNSLDSGDVYWGGLFGANWELWDGTGNAGGFEPDRGSDQYWTPDDPPDDFSGHQGQWNYAQGGIDDTPLSDGLWLGLTVARGPFELDNLDSDYNVDKQAPALIAVPEPAALSLLGIAGPWFLARRRRWR